MGFLAKQRTKARTAAEQHASALSPEWGTEGMVQLASIARAAAGSLAAQKSLRSSGFRGHDTLGIGSAMRSGDSTIWCERTDDVSWTIGLGLNTVTGPAYDWQLLFSSRNVGALTVQTPNVLTKDGSQVHKNEYLETREVVLTGVTSGAKPSLEPEIAACRTGLAFKTLPFADQPAPPFDGGFTISTALDRDGVAGVLPLLGFNRAQERDDGGRWILGLQAALESSYADLAVRDDGTHRTLEFTIHVAADPNLAIGFTAMCHAKRFTTVALDLLKHQDPNATQQGGEGLFDGN